MRLTDLKGPKGPRTSRAKGKGPKLSSKKVKSKNKTQLYSVIKSEDSEALCDRLVTNVESAAK